MGHLISLFFSFIFHYNQVPKLNNVEQGDNKNKKTQTNLWPVHKKQTYSPNNLAVHAYARCICCTIWCTQPYTDHSLTLFMFIYNIGCTQIERAREMLLVIHNSRNYHYNVLRHKAYRTKLWTHSLFMYIHKACTLLHAFSIPFLIEYSIQPCSFQLLVILEAVGSLLSNLEIGRLMFESMVGDWQPTDWLGLVNFLSRPAHAYAQRLYILYIHCLRLLCSTYIGLQL